MISLIDISANIVFRKVGLTISAALIVSTGLVQTAVAQSTTTNDRNTVFFDTPPSVEDMAQHLFPSRSTSKSRGIVVPAKKSADANADTTAPVATENAIGMPVHFHFGKTTLVNASKPFLDQVGKLMSQPDYLRETLIVEGHTDAVGSDKYNHSLSELRALAVKDYLVSKYDIDPKRIFPQGMGESKLSNAQNPNSSENRRVEFLRFDR